MVEIAMTEKLIVVIGVFVSFMLCSVMTSWFVSREHYAEATFLFCIVLLALVTLLKLALEP
jgi:hypothetical protein